MLRLMLTDQIPTSWLSNLITEVNTVLIYDLVAKANNLMIGKISEPQEGRIEIAKIILEAAVEVINSGSAKRRDELTDEIVEFGENGYGMVLPDCVLDSYIQEIQEDLKKARWDKRLLIKIKYFNISNVHYTATLEMDLEKTVENMGWDKVSGPEDRDHISDVVEDNPSMETLNALNRFDDTRRKRGPSLSSYPTSRFVQRVQARDR